MATKFTSSTARLRFVVTVETPINHSVASYKQKRTTKTLKTSTTKPSSTFTVTVIWPAISTTSRSSLTLWFSAWTAKTGFTTTIYCLRSYLKSCTKTMCWSADNAQVTWIWCHIWIICTQHLGPVLKSTNYISLSKVKSAKGKKSMILTGSAKSQLEREIKLWTLWYIRTFWQTFVTANPVLKRLGE